MLYNIRKKVHNKRINGKFVERLIKYQSDEKRKLSRNKNNYRGNGK